MVQVMFIYFALPMVLPVRIDGSCRHYHHCD